MSKRVHVLIDGEQFGPYPEAEFRQHVSAQKILKTDLVWREGLGDWVTVAEFLDKLDTTRPDAPGRQPPSRPALAELSSGASANTSSRNGRRSARRR